MGGQATNVAAVGAANVAMNGGSSGAV